MTGRIEPAPPRSSSHLAAPHTAAFLAQIGPAVDGTLEVTRFEVSDYGPLFGR